MKVLTAKADIAYRLLKEKLDRIFNQSVKVNPGKIWVDKREQHSGYHLTCEYGK